MPPRTFNTAVRTHRECAAIMTMKGHPTTRQQAQWLEVTALKKLRELHGDDLEAVLLDMASMRSKVVEKGRLAAGVAFEDMNGDGDI